MLILLKAKNFVPFKLVYGFELRAGLPAFFQVFLDTDEVNRSKL